MTNTANSATPITNGSSLNTSKSSTSLVNLNNEMVEKGMASRKISSISLYEESNQCSLGSILPSMNRFINAINNMTNVVMVPSKLYDFETEEPMDQTDAKSVHSLSSEEDGLSHSSSVGSNLLSFEANPTGSASSDDSAIQEDQPQQQQQQQEQQATTLYDHYRMLVQAKEQLLWGSNATNNQELDDSPLSKQFRNNLQQMNVLLAQFADMADLLTNKYQQQVEN